MDLIETIIEVAFFTSLIFFLLIVAGDLFNKHDVILKLAERERRREQRIKLALSKKQLLQHHNQTRNK